MTVGIVTMSEDAPHNGKRPPLDAVGARSKPHREIASYVREEIGVSAWWAQSVTVGYERIHGLREKGQRRGGGFEVNKSRTFAVPIETLYRAFSARYRAKWMGGAGLTVRKATSNKSIRYRWSDETPVDVYFWEKAPGKSQLQLQHRELATKAAAERLKEGWTTRLSALGDVLESMSA